MNRLKKPVQATLLSVSTLLSVVMAQDAAAPAAVAQNSAPSVSGIPAEMIEEGKQFAQIKLDSYVSDPEDKPETMRWTATGQKDLQVTIANRVATIKTPHADWSGEETITFTATDPKGASGAETITIIVSSVNDKPVIKPIPGQEIEEGRSFNPIKLDDFIDDIDHPKDQISWMVDVQATGPKADGDLYVNIDNNRVAKFEMPDTNWFGAAKVTFTATDGDGESVSTSANFVVKSVNDMPIAQKAPDQSIEEGNEFDTFNLNDLVSDADDDPSKIKWDVTGGNQLKASIDKYNTVSIKIPNQDWNGPTETFTFTATDSKGGTAKFNVAFTVKSINDEPLLGQIKDQTVNEGKPFAQVNLAEVVKDPDHSFDKLKWTFSGNQALKVLQAGPMATIAVPDTNWNGSESITFKVTDPEGASAETMASFSVNSVNDLPVLSDIVDQTIDEGKQFVAIQLDNLVQDADHKDADLSWEFQVKHQGKEPETGTLMVNVDDNRIARIAIPDTNWNGAAAITFTVTDSEGGKASKTANFTVKSINDLPALRKFADQTVEEGNEFEPVSLAELVVDADHPMEKLSWSVSGNNGLKASIDPKSNMLIVKAPHEEWNGPAETITVTVKDPEGGTASASAKFTVKSINDVPELAKPIESQSIDEKKQFATIDLKTIVKDKDHSPEQLKWSVTGNKDLKVQISAERIATVAIPSPNWNGEEALTFTVSDPEGAKVESQATFTVRSINDLPILKEIPSQTIGEGKAFNAIKLDDLVSDADHSKDKLTWETAIAPANGKGSAQLQVQIDANRLARIVVPDTNWYGSEVVTFTVTDPDGGRATSKATFTVNSVNDIPMIGKVADQNIDEGAEFATINLDEVAFDADHRKDQLNWTVSGNQKLLVTVDQKSRIATVKAPSKLFNGAPETLTFTVTDPDGGKASTQAKFGVKSINNVPALAEIANQTVNEGGAFAPIDLAKLASDADHSYNQLKWSITGNKQLKVNIDAAGKASLVIPGENWFGEETLTFTVMDPEGAKASRTATFKVTSVNDLPVLKKIGDQSIDEKKQFAVIDLNTIVTDTDHNVEQIGWQISSVSATKKGEAGKLQFKVEKGKLQISQPDAYWNGSEVVTFTATDPEGGKATTSATFTVRSINDLPILAKIPDQNLMEKQVLQPIDLGNLVKDADHPMSSLKWEITGNKDLKIVLDKNGLATITAPSKFWNGTEKVNVSVTDPDGGKASQVVTLAVKSVNDVPMISGIKGQSIEEGKSFAPIALDAIVNDDDHEKSRLKWAVLGGKDLKASIDGSRIATIKTPNENWSGAETLTFSVTDPEGGKAEANVVFEVRSINDKPELKTIAGQDVDEGKDFRSVRLDDFVTDVDNKKEELKWTAQVVSVAAPAKKGAAAPASSSDLKVVIDGNRVANIMAPDSNWNGNRKVVFTVADPIGATASQTVAFNVRSVNDVPQLHNSLKEPKTINEGEQFPEIDLPSTVRDADNGFSSLKFALSGNAQLKAVIVGNKLKVTPPDAEWAGKETITFAVTDPEGGKAEARIPYEVKPVNDPPVIAKIGDQTIKEGDSFKPVDLAALTKDPDNRFNELQWSIAGAKDLKAEIRGGQLVVTVPHADYYGKPETLTLTAKDPAGATASTVTTFAVNSVNDLPVLKGLSPQNIREGQQFKAIRLDDIVTDADHKKELLNWTVAVSGGKAAAPAKKGAAPVAAANDLKVMIDAQRVAYVVLPDSNWNGERTATFTVTDPEGGKASQTVVLGVASVNDAPVLAKISDQVIQEGGKFNALDLSGLTSDADHSASALKYEVSGSRELKSTVSAKGLLTVTTPDNDWSGEEKLMVVVTDPEGGRATQPVLFKATAVNDAPVVKSLAGQKIKEGEKFAMIELANVATDVDNKPNELVWTASGAKALKVEFNTGRPQARITTPNDDWSGSENITFTVKDRAGASASVSAMFEVASVNDLPTLSKPQDQMTEEGKNFVAVNFAKLVKDPDDKVEDLSWTLDDGEPAGKDAKGKPTRGKASTVKHQIRFNIDDKGVLTANLPDENWNGMEIVRVNVWDAAKGKAFVDVKFTVKPVNDAPEIVKQLEDQVTFEGTPFKVIKLDQFVKDADHTPQQIRWSTSSQNFNVSIGGEREATVRAKRPDWFGEDKITFTATDPLGAKSSFTANFIVKHVNAVPEMRPIADQTVQEDVAFKPIKMADYARDKDNKFEELKWDITGNKELLVSVDRVRNEIQVKQPRSDWNGKPETLTFKVTDPEGASKSVSATFTVNPVNDPPVVISHAYQTREGEPLTVSKADGVLSGASDPDGDKPEVAVQVNRPSNGMLTLNPDGSFTYTPKPGFYGLDEFTFKARDKGGVMSNVERAEVNVSFRVGDVRKDEVKKPDAKADAKTAADKAKATLKK